MIAKRQSVVDYDLIAEMFNKGPVTVEELKKVTGMNNACLSTLITNLSLMLPIWSPSRGVYKLVEESDGRLYT